MNLFEYFQWLENKVWESVLDDIIENEALIDNVYSSLEDSEESTDIQTNAEEKPEVYARLYKNIATRCGTVYRKQACLLGGEPLYHYDIYLSPEVAGIDSDEEEVYFGGTGNLDYWLANFSEKLKVVK